jgi:hypothetical protein
MLRVKFRKSYKGNKRGDITETTNNEAHALIELGVAEITTQTVSEATTYEDKVIVGDFSRIYKTK